MTGSRSSHLNPFSHAKRSGPHGLYSQSGFRSVIERERHRADRNAHEFALAVFDFDERRNRSLASGRLAEVLGARVRCTDEVGWVSDAAVGVLLPETHPRGAWLFAQMVAGALRKQGLGLEYRVYGYPARSAPSASADDRQLTLAPLLPPAAKAFGPAGAPDDGFPEFVLYRRSPGGVRAAAGAGAADDLHDLMRQPPALWKRALDILGALLGLVLLSPLMLPIAVAIKIQSPGPVFFRQQRVGYKGKPFTCWKFRTMRCDADTSVHHEHVTRLIRSSAPMTKLDAQSDARLIPVGRLLRMTGLDEVPQLLNVLRGEMSLIGPRPCIPYEYRELPHWQWQRSHALPGLTGLWQVSGKNRTTFTEMVRLDIAYAKRHSLWLDLAIMVRTVPAVLAQVWDDVRRRPAERTPQSMPAAPAQPDGAAAQRAAAKVNAP
jgi:lipopolysaccharide/colanic/teichoic acid biosynthesis glycosyltransferase